jgi:GTPase Era involved in 16S rRNA processing
MDAAVKVTVALNKVDLVSPKSKVLSVVDDVKLLLAGAPQCSIDEIFLVCALPGRGEGVADLTQHLLARAYVHPWLYQRGTVSTSTIESIVAEMVRERQEVPYSCRVIVQECHKIEDENGHSFVRASASILVKKSLHKVLTLVFM